MARAWQAKIPLGLITNLAVYLLVKFQLNTWLFLSDCLTVAIRCFYSIFLSIQTMQRHLNLHLLQGLRGLEIAGPSLIFGADQIFPVYSYIGSLDDFSHPRPLNWGGRPLFAGGEFCFADGCPPGRQYVGDATILTGIDDESYDVIVGSHVLEHIANPLKAMRAWLEALRPNGLLFQVIPHYEGTFDCKRPLTTLTHMIEDYERCVAEDDRTHCAEVEALSTQKHSAHWFSEAHLHRGLHHHVFDTAGAVGLYHYLGLTIVGLAAVEPHHIAILGRKNPEASVTSLSEDEINLILKSSPFRRDRMQARTVIASTADDAEALGSHPPPKSELNSTIAPPPV